jgi:hypothetical protein
MLSCGCAACTPDRIYDLEISGQSVHASKVPSLQFGFVSPVDLVLGLNKMLQSTPPASVANKQIQPVKLSSHAVDVSKNLSTSESKSFQFEREKGKT